MTAPGFPIVTGRCTLAKTSAGFACTLAPLTPSAPGAVGPIFNAGAAQALLQAGLGGASPGAVGLRVRVRGAADSDHRACAAMSPGTHPGTVTLWAHGKARVRLEDGRELTASPGSKLRGQVLVGERVELVLSPDGTLARIVARVDEQGPPRRVRASERRRVEVLEAQPTESPAPAGAAPHVPPGARPVRALPPVLARAVAAALAAGESPWTIAARHGLDPSHPALTPGRPVQ